MSARTYDVVVTVREHWSIRVVAESAAAARAKVERGQYTEAECFQHGDRVFTGIKVRREDASA